MSIHPAVGVLEDIVRVLDEHADNHVLQHKALDEINDTLGELKGTMIELTDSVDGMANSLRNISDCLGQIADRMILNESNQRTPKGSAPSTSSSGSDKLKKRRRRKTRAD